jgi:hypothetical protein
VVKLGFDVRSFAGRNRRNMVLALLKRLVSLAGLPRNVFGPALKRPRGHVDLEPQTGGALARQPNLRWHAARRDNPMKSLVVACSVSKAW